MAHSNDMFRENMEKMKERSQNIILKIIIICVCACACRQEGDIECLSHLLSTTLS